MTEWKLFDGDVPYVSTLEFHRDRERAPHLEQWIHQERLRRAAEFVRLALEEEEFPHVVDLGCGDGGLLSTLEDTVARLIGWDFQPSNQDGWKERGLPRPNTRDVMTYGDFVAQWWSVPRAGVYVMTEVLEHLADPHEAVYRVRAREAQLVCSSPWGETYESHDECHAWAWDLEGYAKLLTDAGFELRRHEKVGIFQVAWVSPA